MAAQAEAEIPLEQTVSLVHSVHLFLRRAAAVAASKIRSAILVALVVALEHQTPRTAVLELPIKVFVVERVRARIMRLAQAVGLERLVATQQAPRLQVA